MGPFNCRRSWPGKAGLSPAIDFANLCPAENLTYGRITLGNMTQPAIRPADPGDAQLASRLITLSMGELADYLFGGTHLSVDEILTGLFLLEGNRFSRTIVVFAEWDGQPAGMLVSFPGWEFARRELAIGLGLLKLCGLWDVLRLSVPALSIANGVETYRDEYYLANMAVFPDFRGRGIGSALLGHAEEKARRAGLKKCSLIVDTENPAARRLYERCGYKIVFTKTYPGPAENAHAGYHRMLKEVE